MRVFLLDASTSDDAVRETIRQALEQECAARGWDLDTMTLESADIAHCLGCFNCWTRTPGVCIQDDDGRKVLKGMVQSDIVVTVSPVLFGCYSYLMKRAIDRIIGAVLPFFTRVHGETHHPPRYDKTPCLLAIGIMKQHDSEEETVFRELIERNAINGHYSKHIAEILTRDMDGDEIVGRIRESISSLEVAA